MGQGKDLRVADLKVADLRVGQGKEAGRTNGAVTGHYRIVFELTL